MGLLFQLHSSCPFDVCEVSAQSLCSGISFPIRDCYVFSPDLSALVLLMNVLSLDYPDLCGFRVVSFLNFRTTIVLRCLFFRRLHFSYRSILPWFLPPLVVFSFTLSFSFGSPLDESPLERHLLPSSIPVTRLCSGIGLVHLIRRKLTRNGIVGDHDWVYECPVDRSS